MKELKIYLDTSVWNFIYADDAPEKQEVTEAFFKDMHQYEIFISAIVLEEIQQAPKSKREQLEYLLKEYKPIILEGNNEITRLANIYVEKGIIPVKKHSDAFHIAYSTYYELNILLSWNYKHLANVFKKRRIMAVNLEEGYDKPIEFITPLEVLNDDKD